METRERVPPHFALASIGNRFLACATDHLIQPAAVVLIVLLFAGRLVGERGGTALCG